MKKKPGHKTLDSWRNYSSYFSGALLLFVVICLTDSLVGQVERIRAYPKSILLSGTFILVPAAFALLTAALVLKWKDRPWISHVPLALIMAGALCHIGWVLYFDSFQTNDFGYYLRCAEDFIRTGDPVGSDFCMPVYWKRTAFYTYPITALFGPSLLAIKLVNVGLMTLASWLFYKTSEMIFGFQKAAIALSLFMWQPDLWYAATLASHDIPGVFWLSLFFYLVSLIHLKLRPQVLNWKALTLLSLGLGGTLFFLDVSRSYHYGAIVALVLFLAVRSRLILAPIRNLACRSSWILELSEHIDFGPVRRWRRILVEILLFLIIPAAIYQAGNRAFWSRWDYSQMAQGKGLTCFLSAIDVIGVSEWSQTNNWQDKQCPLIPPGEQTIFAFRKVLQDVFVSPIQYLKHIEHKNRILGEVDDYILLWATRPGPDPGDHFSSQVKRVNRSHLIEQAGAAAMLQALLLLLVLWRLVILSPFPFRMQELPWMVFSLSYFLMFLFLVESQGRYGLFLIFPFASMSAISVEDLWLRLTRKKTFSDAPFGISFQLISRGGAVLLVLLGLFWGTSKIISGSFLTLRDQSGFEQIPESRLPLLSSRYSQVPPRFMINNHKQLMLGYRPGASVEADRILAVQKTFPVQERPDHHLRFFISTYGPTQGDFEVLVPWKPEDFEFMLFVDDTLMDTGSLSDIQDNRYYAFESGVIRFSSRMTISLIVRNKKRLDQVAANRCPVVALELIDLQ